MPWTRKEREWLEYAGRHCDELYTFIQKRAARTLYIENKRRARW